MVRDRKNRVAEEEFYYRELDMNRMSSLPTMSHRDMARPPHEDPEYQKQLVLEATNQPQYNGAGPSYIIDNNNTSHCNKSSSPKQPVQVGVIRHSGNVIIVGVKPSRVRDDPLLLQNLSLNKIIVSIQFSNHNFVFVCFFFPSIENCETEKMQATEANAVYAED